MPTVGCELCEKVRSGVLGAEPLMLYELTSSAVFLEEHQIYRGYCLVVYKKHVEELFQLTEEERVQFCEDMNRVAEAVYAAFEPRKMNYELLGNKVPHLHWHVIPRYESDEIPEWPIWTLKYRRQTQSKPMIAPSEYERTKNLIMNQLAAVPSKSSPREGAMKSSSRRKEKT